MKPWALLLVLAMLVAACETPGPRPPVAVNHVTATPTPPPAPAASAPASPQPTVSPTPAPAPPGRCHTSGLQISVAGTLGAAGTIVATFRVANTQASPCTLYGFVGMLMLDGSGAPLPTRVVRNGGFFSNQAGPSQFVLQPATAASFQAAWSDVTHANDTGPCPQAARLEITPPDEFDHLVIPVTWFLAPCNAGEIDVTPIRAAGAGSA